MLNTTTKDNERSNKLCSRSILKGTQPSTITELALLYYIEYSSQLDNTLERTTVFSRHVPTALEKLEYPSNSRSEAIKAVSAWLENFNLLLTQNRCQETTFN